MEIILQRSLKACKVGGIHLVKQHRRKISIFNWFTRFTERPQLSPFDTISHTEIKQETGVQPSLVYLNNLYWTPRFYQASTLSQEFLDEIAKFKGIQVWKDQDILVLTQLILIEATRDTTFDVSFNFRAKPSPLCQFHGKIDCLMYQRYGGEDVGISDLKEELKNKEIDDQGIGFPLVPVFFPVQTKRLTNSFTEEAFKITQIVSSGLWCLEHMNDIDPQIEYVRLLHTDGHRWRLYEVHRSHMKKTKFFEPRASLRQANNKLVRFTDQARFFDDYEHMLSVIGLIRFALGIPENIVMANEAYDVEELPKQKDLQRTIQKSLLSVEKSANQILIDKRIVKEIGGRTKDTIPQLPQQKEKDQSLLEESNKDIK